MDKPCATSATRRTSVFGLGLDQHTHGAKIFQDVSVRDQPPNDVASDPIKKRP